MTYSLGYITCKDIEEAKTLAAILVNAKLVACANIMDNCTSIFSWDGVLEENNEALMFLKTEEAHHSAITAKVKEHHSYDCPCITFMPISGGNPEFLQWIKEQTA